uniref:P2X purinoceptor n=1 Tax=Denticeps clupeoides TaxID=299321 RepID=A0AAY4BNY0_9TELE
MVLSFFTDFFTYETTKSVVVKSWSVGIINRIVQLLIIVYFIGWVFLHEKAYQNIDTGIESAVMTKVKGFGLYNNQVMDVADYVVPTQGASVFCIITKLIVSENQTQSFCAEVRILTGKCVEGPRGEKRCEIRGWCPAEDDTINTVSPMKEAENFTIFIKNSIRFPMFNVTRGNFPSNIDEKYIKTCKYDPVHNPSCPIFRVGDILKYTNESFNTIGGEIGINVGWVCDLDQSEEECKPSYSFTRLDDVFQDNKVSKGYNFRFAKYFRSPDGTEYRTLHKAFAIRFDILVSGKAGKFNAVPTVINVVAAFTSVGLGTVLCDLILLNFLKGAEQYKAKKFEEVTTVHTSESNQLSQMSQESPRPRKAKLEEKHSEDSGAFSIGQLP